MTLAFLSWLVRIVCAASGHPYTKARYYSDSFTCSCGRYERSLASLVERLR